MERVRREIRMLTELVYDVQRYMSHVSSLHTCNRDTDVFAFTSDRAGVNLPLNEDTRPIFLETLSCCEPCGETNTGP